MDHSLGESGSSALMTFRGGVCKRRFERDVITRYAPLRSTFMTCRLSGIFSVAMSRSCIGGARGRKKSLVI